MTPPPSMPPSRPLERLSGWVDRWGRLVPLLVAEFIVWVGFGALLPVMPLYFTDRNVDIETLGIVIAAWPATRLVAEPVFGWIADRTARVPLMVAGLLIGGVAIGLSLATADPLVFLLLRALAGLGAAMYDPAARGYVTDSTPPPRRGEAFGLYGAAQMGGLLLGPAIGGLGAAVFGGVEFVFWFGAIASALAAIAVAVRVPELPRTGVATQGVRVDSLAEFPAEGPAVTGPAASHAIDGGAGPAPPARLLNRWLAAAVVINIGGYFAGGTYEVIWSLFLTERGAGLDLIGLTFAMFGLPVLLLAPYFGRRIDRQGPLRFVVTGALFMAVASFLYPFIYEPLLVVPVIVVEGMGFAMLGPATYALVARGSPIGRSSTAQGLFGAAGTMGTIVAAVAAGYLAAIDIRWPFWVAAVLIVVLLAVGLAIGGRALRGLGAEAAGLAEASGATGQADQAGNEGEAVPEAPSGQVV